MVNLFRPDIINDIQQTARTGYIPIMQPQLRVGPVVGIAIQVIDAFGVKGTGSTDQAVNFIAFA
jgi:hypothetical protein